MNLSNIDWKKPTTIFAVVLASLAVLGGGIFAIIGSSTVISTATAILSTVTPTATAIPPTATAIPPTATINPCTTEVRAWSAQLNNTVKTLTRAVRLTQTDLWKAWPIFDTVHSRLDDTDDITPPSCDPRTRELQQLYSEVAHAYDDVILAYVAGDFRTSFKRLEIVSPLLGLARVLIEQIEGIDCDACIDLEMAHKEVEKTP